MSPIPSPTPTINYISENAILLQWPEKMCAEQHQHIMYCQKNIKKVFADNLIESIASYASLIIYYRFDCLFQKHGVDTQHHLHESLMQIVNQPFVIDAAEAYQTDAPDSLLEKIIIEIPVYYGEEAGWDIHDVAHRTKLSIESIVSMHSQTIYRAFALGFTPGFCYLGQLPKALQLPRKSTPRLTMPKGAVAIAGEQTAVYPNQSPGGWHIIGQTPMAMTTLSAAHPQTFSSTLSVGQNVRFTAINKEEFLALDGELQYE